MQATPINGYLMTSYHHKCEKSVKIKTKKLVQIYVTISILYSIYYASERKNL